jgi:hypothetical protein
MLCNYFRNTLFWGLLFRLFIVKTWLSVEADAASVFMCGKSNKLVNNPE